MITKIQSIADDVLNIELRDPDGWELPPFKAGAHIEIHLPNGLARHYSLSGNPAMNKQYELAVLNVKNGRGGSRFIHENLAPGDQVFASLPKNYFSLDLTFESYILIAGGIGITPLRSMIFELIERKKKFELWYCAREGHSAAYLEELNSIIPQDSLKVYFTHGNSNNRLRIDEVLRKCRDNTAIYCCGPYGLMDSVRTATSHWPLGTVIFEAFSGLDSDCSIGNFEFNVTLAKSKLTIPIHSGQSILSALRQHDIEINSSCEAGVCKSCITEFLRGTPIHKDLVLSSDERKRSLLVCVSRCSSDELILDI